MQNTTQIMTLAQWADGATWRWELQHSLKRHALIWITRGQGLCTIDGRRRGIGVHNAIAIPAGTVFSLDLGKQGFGQIILIPASGPVLMPDQPEHLRIRDVQAQSELTGILDALLREQNNARDFMDEAMVAQAHLLTIWLRRVIIAHKEPTPKSSAAENLVKAYSALIERDYKAGNPMADYARKLGVTPTHLSRSCKQTSGLTAAEMLTQRTLYAARDMLESGTAPIQRIAAQLGFNSAAYFSRFVLHHTGQTPSALRNQAKRSAPAPR